MEKSGLAKLYAKNSTVQENYGKKLLKMINVPIGGLVLDFGCGTGQLATALSELVGPGGKVVAVDPDAQRIEIAKQKHFRPNIEFLVADDKTFPGEGYDLVVAANVIHWISDKASLFKRIHEKLAPHGQFAFVTANGCQGIKFSPSTKKAFCELFSPDFEERVVFTKWILETIDQYKDLAKSHQFEIISAKTVISEVYWNNLDLFIDFWVAVLPGDIDTSLINEKKVQKFKACHEQQLISEPMVMDSVYMVQSKITQCGYITV